MCIYCVNRLALAVTCLKNDRYSTRKVKRTQNKVLSKPVLESSTNGDLLETSERLRRKSVRGVPIDAKS